MVAVKGAERVRTRPLVMMWKSVWLPPSETFISSQIDSLQNWSSVSVGSQAFESPLTTGLERILYGTSGREVLARRLFEISGRSKRVEKAILSCEPQVIHAHFAHEGYLVSKTARRLRIPFVVSLYGSDVSALPARRGLKGWIFRRHLRETFAAADSLLAISDSIAKQAIRYGASPEKLVVQRVGMNVGSPDRAGDIERNGILFIGRMVPKKGLDHLIKAIASLDDGLRSVPVTVIGDGPLLDEMAVRAQTEGLKFTFLGYQDTTGVLAALRSHELLCVPSVTAANGDSEGLPTVLVQAGGCGLPTVAYAHGGIPEIIVDGKNGLLVPEGDTDKLAAALKSVLADPALRSTLGAGARRVVNADFNQEEQSTKLERIYAAASAKAADRRPD